MAVSIIVRAWSGAECHLGSSNLSAGASPQWQPQQQCSHSSSHLSLLHCRMLAHSASARCSIEQVEATTRDWLTETRSTEPRHDRVWLQGTDHSVEAWIETQLSPQRRSVGTLCSATQAIVDSHNQVQLRQQATRCLRSWMEALLDDCYSAKPITAQNLLKAQYVGSR